MGLLFYLSKKLLIIITILFYLNADIAFAIANNSEVENKFSISLSFTWSINNVEDEIEDSLRSSGFGYTRYHWFGGGSTVYPNTNISGFQWMLDMKYRFSYPLGVGLMLGKTPIVKISGYAKPQGGYGEYLDINFFVFTISPNLTLNLSKGIQISVGPSFNQIKTKAESVELSSNTLGFVADVAAKIYISDILFILSNVQYRYIGEADVGPYTVKDVVGIINPNPSVMHITFPKTTVDLNQWVIGLGIGMDF